jgi:hypothetical protein
MNTLASILAANRALTGFLIIEALKATSQRGNAQNPGAISV